MSGTAVSRLRVHGFLPRTYANGPGCRAGLWLQGCARRCPGCFNAGAWDPAGGRAVPVEALARRLRGLAGRVEGLSVSGGEPLQQVDALVALLRRVRRLTDLSVLVFTGYTWDEVATLPGAAMLLPLVDVLVAGPYCSTEYAGCGLVGSANQTVHLLSDRYTLSEVAAVPPAEVIIRPGGAVVLSGIGGEPLRHALVDGRTFRVTRLLERGARLAARRVKKAQMWRRQGAKKEAGSLPAGLMSDAGNAADGPFSPAFIEGREEGVKCGREGA